MGLRLRVRQQAWEQAVHACAEQFPGLIPVVKGNGYGFGRPALMAVAASLADLIAVGTVFEAGDVPADRTVVVLTPHLGELPRSAPLTVALTIGSLDHVHSLPTHHWQRRVVVKLQSSMRRYGVEPRDLEALAAAARAADCTITGYALHFPLVGTSLGHMDEVEQWLPLLDPDLPVALSHLDVLTYGRLIARHPGRTFHIRCGTALWIGDKSALQLSADVLDVHPAHGDDTVGYRGVRVPSDGHVVLVAAGSSHGVRPLPDGRSPFHFARERVHLIEPSHMHTSMLFVPAGQPCPVVGDRVDVQCPLILTTADEVEWVRD